MVGEVGEGESSGLTCLVPTCACVRVCTDEKNSQRPVRLDMFMSFEIKYEDDRHVYGHQFCFVTCTEERHTQRIHTYTLALF